MSTESKNRARELEIQEISDIMSTEAGRRFINNILTLTGYFDDTFHQDPITHARNAGRRGVGLDLMSNLTDAAPDKVMQLLKERMNNG